jgi:hypothetical protein
MKSSEVCDAEYRELWSESDRHFQLELVAWLLAGVGVVLGTLVLLALALA